MCVCVCVVCSIFTVQLRIRNSEAANERAVVSRLHLVDLAGSERTKKTNASGQVRTAAASPQVAYQTGEPTVEVLCVRSWSNGAHVGMSAQQS